MKVNVKVNGKDVVVDHKRARTGGTLLMGSRFHKSPKDYTRKVKHKNAPLDK
jgi:hypothetical protein